MNPSNETNRTDLSAYHPQVLEHLVGMSQAKQQIKIGLDSAWRDGGCFPSALLTGPAGLGKSLVAQVIAKEMGVELRQALAQNLNDLSNLHGFLLEASDRGVLFIDEADELRRQAQTILYRSLEEGLLFLPKSNHIRTIPLCRFTLLAASNHEASLVEPLRDRFKMLLRFSYYADSEICELLRRRTKAIGWDLTDDVYAEIAARSRGTPRLAIKLLDAARRYVRATADSPVITKEMLLKTCKLEGIDHLGLNEPERQYLSILAEVGAPLRLNVLAMRLGNLPVKTVANVIEAYLVREGLATKTEAGRQITPKGLLHLKSVAGQ